MYMNNVIILILAVRICEDSDTRGLDKRGYTVDNFYSSPILFEDLYQRGTFVFLEQCVQIVSIILVKTLMKE